MLCHGTSTVMGGKPICKLMSIVYYFRLDVDTMVVIVRRSNSQRLITPDWEERCGFQIYLCLVITAPHPVPTLLLPL